MKGKNKLVPRLLGITKESILRLDEKTKEVSSLFSQQLFILGQTSLLFYGPTDVIFTKKPLVFIALYFS